MAFFYSLLPTVKSLTADQKFSFRMQTMTITLKIKLLLIDHSTVLQTSNHY